MTQESSTATISDKLFIRPELVKFSEALPRVREDYGEVAKLCESIKAKGQLQPIVINQDMELICGGRRLAACILGNMEAWVVYRETVDPLEMRELELEENIQRKQFTPAEEVLAFEEIHKLKQTKHGESQSGKAGTGWTQEQTAELIGCKRTTVVENLSLAAALREFPDLKDCKTKSEIRKAVKGLTQVSNRIDALAEYEQKAADMPDTFVIENCDGDEKCRQMEDSSIDILFTDPPYGIDITETAIGVGGQTGGHSVAGFKYDDDTDSALEHYATLAVESYRFVKDNGHVLVFVAPSNFPMVSFMFSSNGWLVAPRPFIWIKNVSGQNNCPDMWFSSCYEMLMYARKQDSRLVVEGKPDWMQCPPVLESERLHQAQKPLPLCKELLSRVSLPGKTMFDPFAGSGSTVIAALELRLFPIACDIMVESYSAILERIVKWRKEKVD